MTWLKNLWNDEQGAVAIEYGLIATLVAIAFITQATDLGTSLQNMFEGLSTRIGAGL